MKIEIALKFVVAIFVIAFTLFYGWIILSTVEVLNHSYDSNPVYSEWNLFEVLEGMTNE